jgi:uncharacterized protein (DUF1697 family)
MVHGRHVALIRGINVGRAKRVSMAQLRAVLEDLGFGEVRTLLNSGNVVFTARGIKPQLAAARMEDALSARSARPCLTPAYSADRLYTANLDWLRM